MAHKEERKSSKERPQSVGNSDDSKRPETPEEPEPMVKARTNLTTRIDGLLVNYYDKAPGPWAFRSPTKFGDVL